jgi:hypothetical protein
MHQVFEITSIVRSLQARGQWDAARVSVTLVPEGVEPDEPEPGFEWLAARGTFRVGRVSLYFA